MFLEVYVENLERVKGVEGTIFFLNLTKNVYTFYTYT